MFRIKRVETLTPAAGWNVTLCLGMFAGFRLLCYVSQQETKEEQCALLYLKRCEVYEGM